MGVPSKSRSILIRNRKGLDNQIQIIVDYETREIGVVHNKGMEMIVIDSILTKDVEVSYAEIPPEKKHFGAAFHKVFDPATTLLKQNPQDAI